MIILLSLVFSGLPLLHARNGEAEIYLEVPLDSLDLHHLYWVAGEKQVTMEVRATIGHSDFFAIGFSERGEISEADLCLLWVDTRGMTRIQDVWTDLEGLVHLEGKNNCDVMGLRRDGPITRLLFQRKLNTCDPHDYVIDEGTTHVVYATGEGPLRTIEELNLNSMEHGFQRVQLLKNMASPLNSEELRDVKVVNNMVSIPGEETTYWCSLHQLPMEFYEKRHVVKYEAVIQKGNEALVHHMEVFHCEIQADKTLEFWEGECPQKPKNMENCKKVIAAWAMGAPALSYPLEAGLPIGGDNFSLYVVLEVHYNNPQKKTDWVDSSGVRFYYTSELREFDAGVMELGMEYTDKMAIPPKQPDFKLSGYCTPECTRVGLPNDGIVVFASQLHTHLTGIKVYTKHIRGGSELEELNRDDHYSTHFQEIRLLKRPRRILPGDALLTTCHYDTSNRENITLGGYAISEEMCVNYIHYYPKTQLEVCKSSIDSNVLQSFFRYLNTEEEERTSARKGVSENYESVKWSRNKARLLDELYSRASLSMQCNKSDGLRFPGYWNGLSLTPILYPLKVNKSKCS